MTTTSATSSSTSTAATTASTSTSSASSNASIGSSILSSLNANGASIDTGTLVTQLTAAQKSSLEDPITAKQTANTAQISAVATLTSDLSTFSTSLNTLIQGGTLQTQPVSSDTSVMTVAAVAGAPVGALSQSVTVNALAYAQSVKSDAYASSSQAFNTGMMTLTVGSGAPINITVDSSNNTLSGIAQAINAKNAGVTANVITGSDGSATLVLKGTTGAANSFKLTSQDDTGQTGTSLAKLSYDGTSTTGLTLTQAAQDASVTVDGVTVTRSSNTFNDVVPGVSMTLGKIGTVNLSSTRPNAAITQAVNDFVSAYNQLLAEINTDSAAATSTASAGPLQGNSAIRQLKTQLSKLTTTPLNATGTIRTLAELGVSTAQDGTLSVNSTTLTNMLTNHPDDVESMFVTSQSSSSSKVLITSAAGSSSSGVFTVTGLTTASGSTAATGSINGIPMSASSWNLTAASGQGADGLTLQILSGTPGSATVTINQGLGGALSALINSMNATSNGKPIGMLATLSASLTTTQSSLADQMTKADAQLQVYHDQLVTKFTQMNTLVSGYKSTAAYLTQQVDLWTKSDN